MHIVALHPYNKIAMAMMEEEGGRLSAKMVTADDDGGRDDRCPSSRRWLLEVVLPSSTLLLSCEDGGLRGAQKPVALSANSIANAVVPARYTAVGALASCGRKTKAETRQ